MLKIDGVILYLSLMNSLSEHTFVAPAADRLDFLDLSRTYGNTITRSSRHNEITDICAARTGDVLYLEWMLDVHSPGLLSTMDYLSMGAVICNNIECLKLTMDRYYEVYSVYRIDIAWLAQNAAERGSFQCMVYLIEEHGVFVDEQLGCLASDHLDCFKYLCEKGLHITDKITHAIGHSGNIECLRYLVSIGHKLHPSTAPYCSTFRKKDSLRYALDHIKEISQEERDYYQTVLDEL